MYRPTSVRTCRSKRRRACLERARAHPPVVILLEQILPLEQILLLEQILNDTQRYSPPPNGARAAQRPVCRPAGAVDQLGGTLYGSGAFLAILPVCVFLLGRSVARLPGLFLLP